jgi:hypothetical protein
MRDNTGRLVIDLGDNTSERVVGTFLPNPTSSVDENQTQYVLFPEAINRSPYILQSIADASIPNIRREELSTTAATQSLYSSIDGTVRVTLGSSFVLKLRAIQPQTLNVDNGVPIIKQREEQLIYNWSKDGEVINGAIFLQDYPRASITVVSGSELHFRNISADAEGSYTCEIANDVGITTTEAIDLLIFNPDSPFDTKFKQNLVQNSIALNGTDSWTTAFGSITTKQMLEDVDGQAPIAVEAKRPWSDTKGYSSDMFYPHPKNIEVVNQRNYEGELQRLANNEAGYFTRENLTYLIAGGQRKVVAYQDVDLTDVVDFITGRVYGVTKVRAALSCYIGNGVTRFLPTEDVVTIADKQNPSKYDQSAPRLSAINIARAGIPQVSEKVQVVFQELYDDQPLKMQVYDQLTKTVKLVDKITFTDPLTEFGNQVRATQTGVTVNINERQITLPADDRAALEIRRFRNMYQNDTRLYYSNGQYVQHNIAYLDNLNKLTNKIRVYFIFDVDDIRISEILEDYVAMRELKDIASFETLYSSAITNPFQPTDKYINKVLQEKNAKLPAEQRVPFNAESRALVTGINVSLFPVTPYNRLTTPINLVDFPKSVLSIPSRNKDLLDRGFTLRNQLPTGPQPPAPVANVDLGPGSGIATIR